MATGKSKIAYVAPIVFVLDHTAVDSKPQPRWYRGRVSITDWWTLSLSHPSQGLRSLFPLIMSFEKYKEGSQERLRWETTKCRQEELLSSPGSPLRFHDRGKGE